MKKLIYKRSDIIAQNYQQEKDRERYEQEKIERQLSPQYQRFEHNRSLLKQMTDTKSKIAEISLNSFNTMSTELLKFIQSDLEANFKLLPPKGQAIEIMRFYKRNFLDLEQLSNNTILQSSYHEPYDKFFVKLIKLNPYFIYFARPKTFEIANIPFAKIPYQERLTMLKDHLTSLGVFENEKFIKRYEKYFEVKDDKKTLS